MTVSKAQNKARNKWDEEHLKTGSYKMKKELYTDFERYCIDKKLSKNGLINKLIRQRLELDGYLTEPEQNREEAQPVQLEQQPDL